IVLKELVIIHGIQWTAVSAEKYVSKLLRISLERIDSLRHLASSQLSLLSNIPLFTHYLPNLQESHAWICQSDIIYNEFVRGLFYSIGNLSDTYLDSSVQFFEMLYRQDPKRLSLCCQTLASFWFSHQKSPIFAHL